MTTQSPTAMTSPQATVEPEFASMVINLLRTRGRLRDANIAKYTTPAHLRMFRDAFIHKSFARHGHYELMEFLGDARIDSIVVQYLHRRFPQVKREGVLTPIKHKLKSGKQLGQFAHELGWFKWARFRPGVGVESKKIPFQSIVGCGEILFPVPSDQVTEQHVRDLMNKEFPPGAAFDSDKFVEFDEYTALLEDIFEAFIGTIIEVIDNVEPMGVSHAVAYNVVSSFLDEIDIHLTREWSVDVVTRLKEMFYDGNKWSYTNSLEVIHDKPLCEHTATLYWYPKGDKTQSDRNAEVFAVAKGRSKPLAIKRVATVGLDRALKMNYTEKPWVV